MKAYAASHSLTNVDKNVHGLQLDNFLSHALQDGDIDSQMSVNNYLLSSIRLYATTYSNVDSLSCSYTIVNNAIIVNNYVFPK